MKNTKQNVFSTKKNISATTMERSGHIRMNDTKGSKNFMGTNTSMPLTENNTIDKGKMRALFRAGWTVGMIAFEMNLPEKEVNEALSYYDENGNWKGE